MKWIDREGGELLYSTATFKFFFFLYCEAKNKIKEQSPFFTSDEVIREAEKGSLMRQSGAYFTQIVSLNFSVTSCGTFLNGPNGVVTSRNYPSNYDNNEYCTWQIQVPVNKKIRLDFSEFKTESGRDFLLIYDTNHFQSPNIAFDGTTYKPPPFTSSGNVLRVRFISDGATTFKGFSFSYKQVGE